MTEAIYKLSKWLETIFFLSTNQLVGDALQF